MSPKKWRAVVDGCANQSSFEPPYVVVDAEIAQLRGPSAHPLLSSCAQTIDHHPSFPYGSIPSLCVCFPLNTCRSAVAVSRINSYPPPPT